MTREEVLKVVTHVGDCYRVKSQHHAEPFNFYVTKIGEMFLEQDAKCLPIDVISYTEIVTIESY